MSGLQMNHSFELVRFGEILIEPVHQTGLKRLKQFAANERKTN